MLDFAIQFLRDELATFLQAKTGDAKTVTLSHPVDETGKYALEENSIGISLINIEEDRIFKAQLPEYQFLNGQHVALEPELKLNLYLLFAAHFTLYDQTLKSLSLVLQFFQAHSFFTSEEYPSLDPRIKKMTVELQSLSYEQLNQVWAFLGGKHLPSIVYKVPLVIIQDSTPTTIQPPIQTIHSDLHNR